MPFPLSVTIIAKDEADRIGDAIRSVGFADEVVVLDSGSSDDTVAVARALGARVVQTDWPGYVAQKNRALVYASHDWVLGLDADERVGPTLAAQIQGVLAQERPAAHGYRFARLSWWEGAPIRHGSWYPDARVRLFDRTRARWTGLDPHDRVEVEGAVARLEGQLEHHPFRDIGEHLQQVDRYSALMSEGLHAAGTRARWWDLVFRPPLHIAKSFLLRAGFRDGVRGLAVAGLGATYVLLKWVRLWLRQRDPH